MGEEPALGKERVAFAVAMLAILLALNPTYNWLHRIDIGSFGVEFRMSFGYSLMGLMLGVSIYCYGWSFIPGRNRAFLRALGDWAYAIALMIPPVFILIYAMATTAAAFRLDRSTVQLLVSIMAAVLGAFAGYAVHRTAIGMKTLDQRRTAALARIQLAMAEDLHREGRYAEAAARCASIISPHRTISVAGVAEAVDRIDRLRRSGPHEKDMLTKAESKMFLEVARRIVQTLSTEKEPVRTVWSSLDKRW